MRRRPIIQWALFLAFWTCLAFPIVLVTQAKRTVSQTQSTTGNSVMTWVSLRFSAEPSYFELLQDGKVLWREDPVDETEFHSAFPISMDEFGAEFILRSSIPADGAIEITVEPDEQPERSQTLWINGEVNETLTFSWSRHD